MAKFWKNTATFRNCISDGQRYTQIYDLKRERFGIFSRSDEVQVSGSGNCPPSERHSNSETRKPENLSKILEYAKKWKTYVCKDSDGTTTTVASLRRGAARTYLRMTCSGRIRRER